MPSPPYPLPTSTGATVTVWNVWALLLGMGMLMLGNGMQGSLLGLRAADAGFSSTVTGLVMSGYFLGFLVGAAFTPVVIRRVGHVRVFAAMASLASIAILVHAMIVAPWVWGALRMLTGFAYSGLYIVAESWLNDRAASTMRGRLLSVYLVVTFVSMAGGQIMLNLASPDAYTLFLLNSIILSLALVPILLSTNHEPDHSAPDPLSLVGLYRISPLGTVGAFATGMSQGTLFVMGAVFAHRSGLSVAGISGFMASLITGGAILQWPIGRLSDGMDRRKVIIGVGLLAAIIAVLTEFIGQSSGIRLSVMGFLLGGTVLPMYSLYLAYTNDHLNAKQMVAASSGLYKALAVGAVLGPVLTGWLMDQAGPSGFLWYFAALHLVMAIFAIYRMTRTVAFTPEEQSPYAPMPMSDRTGELAESWVKEYIQESPTDTSETQRNAEPGDPSKDSEDVE